MRNWKLPLYLSAMVFAISSVFPTSEAQAQGYHNNQGYYQNDVSFDMFYHELAPYGQWDYDRTYGDIWYPNAGRNFRPYSTNGYWTMTEYGNTWVSNYDWGWAPFHYGRWVYNQYRGWGWIPGYEWGPAWVDWRSGNGYYGWAPMMPGGIHISINLPISAWIFAPMRHLYSTNIYRHSSFGRTNIYNRTTIINNTYIVNNNRYYGGPSRNDIERDLGRRVEVRNIRVADRPSATRVDRNSVSIYRPNNSNNNRPSTLSRDNNGRVIDNGTSRRGEATTSNRVNNDRNRVTENRSNTTREMHIDKNGNATVRERNTANTTPSRVRETKERTNNTESRNSNISRNNQSTETKTRPMDQERATPVQPNSQNRGTTQRYETPQRQERQRDVQPQRTQQTAPRQRVQTASQSANIPTVRRENTSSNSSVSRSSNNSASRGSSSQASQNEGRRR